jgi:hypothetical protein
MKENERIKKRRNRQAKRASAFFFLVTVSVTRLVELSQLCAIFNTGNSLKITQVATKRLGDFYTFKVMR